MRSQGCQRRAGVSLTSSARADRVGVFDRANQAQAPTAARACQHADVERAPHQFGPRRRPRMGLYVSKCSADLES